MPIVVVGISHQSAPVAIRERVAFSPGALAEALRIIRSEPGVAEGLIVSTCNRTEIYGAGADAATVIRGLEDFIHRFHKLDTRLGREIYRYEEPRSIEHLFRVVSGLESMVLGETEILGQMKEAYHHALTAGATGKTLNQLFQRAFQVAKKIRSQTAIVRGSISVGSVAVELAEKIFGELAQSQVLIIGAGDTSEKTARALLSRGAKTVIVANRTHERAVALAAELGGRAVRFEEFPREFAHADIVVSSTAAPHHIVTREKVQAMMPARRNRPLFLIDLAVPRDIEPAVHDLDNVYLYNIDDLRGIAEDNLRARQEELAKCDALVAANVAKFRAWLARLPPGAA